MQTEGELHVKVNDAYSRTLSLAAARVNAGITRAEAANEVGITAQQLGAYERGDSEPGAIVFLRLCSLYSVGPYEIRFDEKLLKKKERKEHHERDADGKR